MQNCTKKNISRLEDVIADDDSFYTKLNRLKGGGKVEYQCTGFSKSAFVVTGDAPVEVE